MVYSASIFLKSSSDDKDDPLWEEAIRLVEADSEDSARAKATEIGRMQQQSFVAMSGRLVEWEFVCVERVVLVDSALVHGCEVFSRFLSASDARSLLRPSVGD